MTKSKTAEEKILQTYFLLIFQLFFIIICFEGCSDVIKFDPVETSTSSTPPPCSLLPAEDRDNHNAFAAGEGTAESPYMICNVYQLQLMKENLTAYFELGQDIDASITQDWNSGEGFRPIGNCGEDYNCSTTGDTYSGSTTANAHNPFEGSFDGNNFSISNLYISSSDDKEAMGLFGLVAESAVITDLHIDNMAINLTSNSDKVGIVAGSSFASLHNILVTNSYIRAHDDIGGVVGYLYGPNSSSNLSVLNSYIYGKERSGGIIGNWKGEDITTDQDINLLYDLYVKDTTIKVLDSSDVGLLVGKMRLSSNDTNNFVIFKNLKSINNQIVSTADPSRLGGLFGYIYADSLDRPMLFNNIKVNNFTLNLSSSSKVGGVIGYLRRDDNNIVKMSNLDINVNFENTNKRVAGIVGDFNSYYHSGRLDIFNSVVTGNISATDQVGAFVGRINADKFNDYTPILLLYLTNVFSTVKIESNGGSAGGFWGDGADADITLTNTFFDSANSSTVTTCDQGSEKSLTGSCNAATESDFFNINHAVYAQGSDSQWDFISVWQAPTSSTLPQLR